MSNIKWVFVALLFAGFMGLAQAEPRGIIVEPPAEGGLQVQIWVEKPAYTVGDVVRISFKINKAAYIYIWDISPDGTIRQIFPNAFEPQNFFQAGTYTIPSPGKGYVFQVRPPLGTEWLQILASQQPLRGFEAFSKEAPFPTVGPDPEAWKRSLELTVQGIVPEPTARAYGFTSFQIVAAPVPFFGTLEVYTNPPVAKLYVDGAFRGWTPCAVTLEATVHNILVQKEGYQDYAMSILVPPGRTTRLDIVLVPKVANQPPVARFVFTPPSPSAGEVVTFNGTASYDPDGTIALFAWDLDGDGAVDRTGPIVTWTYNRPGTYNVTLFVTDDKGVTSLVTVPVTVALPTPEGMPLMIEPGIYVWGKDAWKITVKGAATWSAPRSFRLELRTDGQFINASAEAGPGPLGLVPEPTGQGWQMVLEGTITTGQVTYTFQVQNASSIFLDLRLDMDGDGVPDRSTSFVRLRLRQVNPPTNPFVVGIPENYTGPFVPTINFRIGSALSYTESLRIIFWRTTIEALEGL